MQASKKKTKSIPFILSSIFSFRHLFVLACSVNKSVIRSLNEFPRNDATAQYKNRPSSTGTGIEPNSCGMNNTDMPMRTWQNKPVSRVSRTRTTTLCTCPLSTRSSTSAKHCTCSGECGSRPTKKERHHIYMKWTKIACYVRNMRCQSQEKW